MAKRTLDIFDCDICGNEGERYTILYPDGNKALDRCENHNDALLALKDEPGQWLSGGSGKSNFKVSTLEDIERQKK